ncbi:MAG: double zinc ribbon domain-containing protein, partial [Pseudomonadota bacterium]
MFEREHQPARRAFVKRRRGPHTPGRWRLVTRLTRYGIASTRDIVERRTAERAGRGGNQRRGVRLVLDGLYPPTCLLCEEPAAETGGLCAVCWRDTPLIAPPACAL